MTERVAGGQSPKVQKNRNSKGVRVPALALIEENGWKVGDFLTGGNWKAPRSIEQIDGGEVKLRSPKGCGYSWTASLPADARKVKA
ncbi:MAG: hypothetical protein O7G84_01000 [Gammaproteobacteria bacterium]|nr:hypothetical protein [Gammaproteobacteria bacterium]